jgi:hypothetical protein
VLCNSRSFVVVLLTLGFWAFAVVFVPVVTGPTRLTEGLMTESSMYSQGQEVEWVLAVGS